MHRAFTHLVPMKTRKLFPAVVMLLAGFTDIHGLHAQSNTVTLTLEQSTDGLNSWQTIQVSEVVVASTNAFYQMKISVAPATSNMITVQGGTLPQESPLLARTVVETFRIGKYEVTYGEWLEVRQWAVTNGYDLDGIGSGAAANYPVGDVSWYDIAKWCNAKSQKEGLAPVYSVDGSIYKSGESDEVSIDRAANGYRMPTIAEWEWAAQGGTQSQGYVYSGSNDVNAVAWYSGNTDGDPKPVGGKQPNELGIYDMSGNVWELCEEITTDSDTGLLEALNRGGAVNMPAQFCTVRNVGSRSLSSRIFDHGFRLARNAP